MGLRRRRVRKTTFDALNLKCKALKREYKL